MDTEQPIEFIDFIASLASSVDSRRVSPFEPQDDDAPSAADLLVSLSSIDCRETTGMLGVLAVLATDEDARRVARQSFASRHHVVPEWIHQLDDMRVIRSARLCHLLGDGENVHIEFTVGSHVLTANVYIDHNLGTVMKDAFVAAVDIDQMLEGSDELDHVFIEELSLADARAKIDQTNQMANMMVPPIESETWPDSRPVIEWLSRAMPVGGDGYDIELPPTAILEGLADEFFETFGQRYDSPESRALVDGFLWFSGYVGGDPLRWSPVTIEVLLTDWMPRKMLAPADELALVPALLRSYVQYAHDQKGIPSTLTDQTLDAIDRWTPEFLDTIRQPRTHVDSAIAIARSALGLGPDDGVDLYDDEYRDDDWGFDDLSYGEIVLEGLERVAGPNLDALNNIALPDEPLVLSGVEADIHPAVEAISELCDRCCVDMFDAEHRTACRRLLVMAARGDAAWFRRRARAETAAAAIVWIVARANKSFDSYSGGGRRVGDLADYFGLSSSPGARAETLLKAAGLPTRHYGMTHDLGERDLLTSGRRGSIISLRDRYRAEFDI